LIVVNNSQNISIQNQGLIIKRTQLVFYALLNDFINSNKGRTRALGLSLCWIMDFEVELGLAGLFVIDSVLSTELSHGDMFAFILAE